MCRIRRAHWRSDVEYHIDREIRLSEDSQHKNLYSWSLQEFTSDGVKTGSDQIPWKWSLYFSASEISHVRSIKLQTNDAEGDLEESNNEIEDSESINATLHPGIFLDGRLVDRNVSYSMFGADRNIECFTLRIYRLDEGELLERCQIWGGVSYTTEIDFRDETEPDAIEIYMWVLPSRYESLRQAVGEENTAALSMRLSGVSGFYSEWSPSISTSRIKVLAPGDAQDIVVPDRCSINPPKLGLVGEFELTVVCRKRLDIGDGAGDRNLNFMDIEEEVSPRDQGNYSQMIQRLVFNEKTITKLSTPLWIIVALLVYVVLR